VRLDQKIPFGATLPCQGAIAAAGDQKSNHRIGIGCTCTRKKVAPPTRHCDDSRHSK